MSDEDAIRAALSKPRWAVVGASPNPARASHGVTRTLIDRGYEVIPVNPNADEVHGLECLDSLSVAHERGLDFDVVDIFRRSEDAGTHVDEAIEYGAEAVWMQLGVIDEAAASRATDAGLVTVMDHCPKIELSRFGIEGPTGA